MQELFVVNLMNREVILENWLLKQLARLLCLYSFSVSPYAFADGATFINGNFVNDVGPWQMDLPAAIKAMWSTDRSENIPNVPIPLLALETEMLEQSRGSVLYRLGHSTVLLKLGDDYVMTDPVFSERASPLQWLGPKRFHQPPIEIQALPKISAVVVSHDHYDHLDKRSIVELADKTGHFIVPLRVGDHLRRWGIPEAQIIELDWWQEVQLGDLQLVATPAQHLSGRGLFDRNETLWASWVIMGAGARIFFSGDSGYFPGFRDIGERYGPFDVTLVENGAYNPAWPDIHMMPAESVQAHIDLNGRLMLPIHNSTFDLSLHPWYEPMERVSALAAESKIEVATPVIGAKLSVLNPSPTYAWWREIVQNHVSIR